MSLGHAGCRPYFSLARRREGDKVRGMSTDQSTWAKVLTGGRDSCIHAPHHLSASTAARGPASRRHDRRPGHLMARSHAKFPAYKTSKVGTCGTGGSATSL